MTAWELDPAGHKIPRGQTPDSGRLTRSSVGSDRTELSSEEWRPVVGWEGLYEVSDQGRVRSLDRAVVDCRGTVRGLKGRILRPKSHPAGHQFLSLSRAGVKGTRWVHHLVLECFTGPRPAGLECLHDDGNPKNNCASNLSWGTRGANIQDSIRHGTNPRLNKTVCPRGHALDWPNLVPSKLPSRQCLACDRAKRTCAYRGETAEWFIAEADRRFVEIMGGE